MSESSGQKDFQISGGGKGDSTKKKKGGAQGDPETAKRDRDSAKREVDAQARRLEEARNRLAVAEAHYKETIGSTTPAAEVKEGGSWHTQFQKLVEYKSQHGHCLVPHSTKGNKELTSLGRWVANQRVFYKMHQDGKPGHIKPHRIETLEKVGFVWNVNDMLWENKLQELIKYKTINGTCDIPSKCPKEYKKIRNWVELQRQQYRLFRAKRTTSLTQDRIKKLEDIGFDWKMDEDGDPGSRKKRRNIIDPSKDELEEWWNTSFDELKTYKEKHGHCRMHQRISSDSQRSRQGTSRLRNFASWQRKEWKRLQKGEPSDMTPDRIEKLQEIGFEFVTNPKVPSASKKESGEDDKNKKEKVVAESYMSDTEGAQESAQV
jgi:hypothetical protein